VRQVAGWNVLPGVRMDMPVAINVRDSDVGNRVTHINIFRGSYLNPANVAIDNRLRFPSVFKSEIVEILSLPPVHNTISLEVDRSPG
jgi:hypothetical protein